MPRRVRERPQQSANRHRPRRHRVDAAVRPERVATAREAHADAASASVAWALVDVVMVLFIILMLVLIVLMLCGVQG